MTETAPRFAGRKPRYPARGTFVEVLEGDHVGQVVEVIKVSGHAFDPILRVVVQVSSGEFVWYWPWNLKISA
jgi:hypothetical protein